MKKKRTWVAVPESRATGHEEEAAYLGLPVVGRRTAKLVVGRNEWLSLPELGVEGIHAKVDTGAFSSSLHAEQVEVFEKDGADWVRFITHDYHGCVIRCELPVLGHGPVKSSTGRSRKRVFIKTVARTPGGMEWEVRLSLADRSVMRCPMLLGRTALSGRFVVDPSAVNVLGRHA